MNLIKRISGFFQNFFQGKSYSYIQSKIKCSIIVNSIISSIIRKFFGFKQSLRFYYNFRRSIDIDSFNNYWIIRIGFKLKRSYFPFINVDRHLSNRPSICTDINKLSCFGKNSCQMIYIKHFFEYFSNDNFNRFIHSWNNILIPGGILKIQVKVKNNKIKIASLKKSLEKYHFFIKSIQDFDIKINGTKTITAIKEKESETIPSLINPDKLKDIVTILKENQDLFSGKSNVCLIDHQLKKIYDYIKDADLSIENLELVNNIRTLKDFSDNYFDFIIIANFIEYCNYSFNKILFDELRRVLKAGSKFLIIIPEWFSYSSQNSNQIFDKGIFLKILDDLNIDVKWMNLSSSFKMIQVLLNNQDNFPTQKKQTKILLLGNYDLRYTFLSNARWESQVRGFKKLGYNIHILDIRNHSFKYFIRHIELYEPDILWIAGKVAYLFLKEYSEFFRRSKLKVGYWFWDIRPPVEFDFNGVIDYMFITSKGEISLYKEAYNLDNVYYMPPAIIPEIIHRNKSIREKYDIGFAGLLTYSIYHKKRTEMINFIRKQYQVKIFENIYQNLQEYYNQCKIVFGGTPDLAHLEYYASNRIYIAMSCGSCFLTNYFIGLERLAENKKHLLWYNDKEDLMVILKKYLSEDKSRSEIRDNAEKLAREKHNYTLRIQNMIDIVENKTKDLYFLIK